MALTTQKAIADGIAVHTFEESPVTSTVNDKRFEVLQGLRRRAGLLIQPRPSASHLVRTSFRLGDQLPVCFENNPEIVFHKQTSHYQSAQTSPFLDNFRLADHSSPMVHCALNGED